MSDFCDSLLDSIPIQSSHDWEAAFGFKSSANETGVSSADDELGFDPWLECSKGFADLMKEEKHTKSTPDSNLVRFLTIFSVFRRKTFIN